MAITTHLKNQFLNNLIGKLVEIRQATLLTNDAAFKILESRIVCLFLEYDIDSDQCLIHWNNRNWRVNPDSVIPAPYKKGKLYDQIY